MCLQIACFVLGALVAMNCAPPIGAESAPLSEYQVKAAFLYHFAQFVEWPPDSLNNAKSPLMYCTIGNDPFHGALDDALGGKMIGTHPLQVRHAKQAQDAYDCQVVFLGEGEKKLLAPALALLKDRPVLVVGESEHFAEEGGTIGFCMEGNKVRFEINLDSAAKANLRISSRLLALAKNVIGGQRGKGNGVF